MELRCFFRNASFRRTWSFPAPDQSQKWGVIPSMRDTTTVFVCSWLALLSDSPFDPMKPLEVVNQFRNELANCPIDDTIGKYSSLFDALVNSQTMSEHSGLTTLFLPVFKETPIFREYLHWYRTGDPSAYIYLETFCRFGKKLEIRNDALKPTALRKWVRVEERLSSLELDQSTLNLLRKIVHVILDDTKLTHFMGKHGPGAVAGKPRGYVAKSANLYMSPKLRRFWERSPLLRDIPREEIAYISENYRDPSDVSDQLAPYYSELDFVAKNNTSLRTICKESASVMLPQQHIREDLTARIENGLAGIFIKIADQSRNRHLALVASDSLELDTLDLEHSSDSVTWELVLKTFPVDLLHGLSATRSIYVKVPDGPNLKKSKLVRVHKFAPMGSAVCFPVQSIIFCAVSILAYALYDTDFNIPDDFDFKAFVMKAISKDHRGLAKYHTLGVYGDDIITDRRTSEIVISLLQSLGFVVNESKSFIGGVRFRESCGMFALGGKDVTPLVFKMKPLRWNPVKKEGQHDVASLSSICALANRAGDYGYRRLQSHLIHVALEYGAKPKRLNQVPFLDYVGGRMDNESHSNDLFLYSKNPRNTHILRKRSQQGVGTLQRDEMRVLTISKEVREFGERFVTNSLTKTVYHDPTPDQAWYLYHSFVVKGINPPKADVETRRMRETGRTLLRNQWIGC